MRACVQSFLLAACLLAPSGASLAQGIYLPPAPQGPGGEDAIETSSGTRCRQSINGNGAYVDVGVAGSTANRFRNFYSVDGNANRGGTEALGYARITMPLGKTPTRLDCSRLYELEIARLKREIELLELAAE
jgi:hypothetical protein